MESATDTSKTLYERLGGDKFIADLTQNFWDEMLENEELRPFFKHTAMMALKYHLLKFFRVLLGPDHEKPDMNELQDYLLQTHSRLFREKNLDMNHFDEVADCLQQSLDSFNVPKVESKQVMDIWNATRAIFEYGTEVANMEREMTPEQIQALPVASSRTMGTGAKVQLPPYSQIPIPDWLTAALSKALYQTNVRAWTCELTERFSTERDAKIAGPFMYQPFMAHHVYCAALLEMAFMPDDIDTKHRLEITEIVMYPRGRNHSRLSKSLFDNMIVHVVETCRSMGMPEHATKAAESKLKTYRQGFSSKTSKCDGTNAPHVLSKAKHAKKSSSSKSKDKAPQSPKSSAPPPSKSQREQAYLDQLDDSSHGDGDQSTSSAGSSFHSGSSIGGSKGGGWLNFFKGNKVMHVVR